MSEQRAAIAATGAGLAHRVVEHGPVSNAEEAARARGVEVTGLVKTMVVRRGDDDFVLVLVPGDRQISWPRLRSLLGVNRLSMPDADTALAATGYARGTITPFGTTRTWPVVADERLRGRTVALGGGAHGVAIVAEGDDVLAVLDAEVADVTDPAPG